ncbi:MAG: nuclear transport factor 2 family protein [Candidatus Limnocylindria bacterium]
MFEPKPLDTFLTALGSRDFGLLATCLSPDATARLLLPRGPEEISGRDPIARRFEGWFAPATEFEVLSTTRNEVGQRHRLTWRFRTVRPGRSREVVEQVAYCDVSEVGIERIDLLCSGFLADEMPASCDLPVRHVFEAGAMGCADGLAEEFRRRMAGVPVGASLSVVVRDPAAKEDLPALARMLGQAVTSMEAHDDGRLTINVEKRR